MIALTITEADWTLIVGVVILAVLVLPLVKWRPSAYLGAIVWSGKRSVVMKYVLTLVAILVLLAGVPRTVHAADSGCVARAVESAYTVSSSQTETITGIDYCPNVQAVTFVLTVTGPISFTLSQTTVAAQAQASFSFSGLPSGFYQWTMTANGTPLSTELPYFRVF